TKCLLASSRGGSWLVFILGAHSLQPPPQAIQDALNGSFRTVNLGADLSHRERLQAQDQHGLLARIEAAHQPLDDLRHDYLLRRRRLAAIELPAGAGIVAARCYAEL